MKKSKTAKNVVPISITLPVGMIDQLERVLAAKDETRSQYFRKLAKEDLARHAAESEHKQAA